MENSQEIPFIAKRRKVNPKALMYAFNIGFMLVMILLMTLGNLIIDPEHFNFFSWLTKSLILMGIQIPSIILGELMGRDRQMSVEGGLYQKALRRLNDNLASIAPIKVYFSQFFFWFKQRENFNKKVSYLMAHDFDGLEAVYIVKHLRQEDLDAVSVGAISKETQDGKRVVIKAIPEYKMKWVRDVVCGGVSIKDDSYAYYLFADEGGERCQSVLEEGAAIEKARERNKLVNRITKVAVSTVFSLIWAMIAIDTAQGAGSADTWLNLVSRLSAMVAGITSGYMTSVTDTKLAAKELNAKSSVLEEFKTDIGNGTFVPKSYEELALEELDAQNKAVEEAKKGEFKPLEEIEDGHTDGQGTC